MLNDHYPVLWVGRTAVVTLPAEMDIYPSVTASLAGPDDSPHDSLSDPLRDSPALE
jgi:hypothetical protein